MKKIIYIILFFASIKGYCQDNVSYKLDSLTLNYTNAILSAQKEYDNAISKADKVAIEGMAKLEEEEMAFLEKTLLSEKPAGDEISKFNEKKQKTVDKLNVSTMKLMLDAQKSFEIKLVEADKEISKAIEILTKGQETYYKKNK